MLSFPSLSSWQALHPALSHFPIVLLTVGPLLVVLALVARQQRRTLMLVALGLLAVGTVAVYLSASSGDEAKVTAPQTVEVTTAIERHEQLGSALRAVATAMTVLLSGILFGPGLLKKELGPRAFSVLAVVFLTLSLGCGLLVVGAAHSGGLLVHKLGVHAPIR
jgi:uncharacterized membrane protein